MQSITEFKGTEKIKPAVSSYIVIPLLLLVAWAIFAIGAHAPQSVLVVMTTVFGVLATAWDCWVHAQAIILTLDGLVYTANFVRQRIAYSDLTSVALSIGSESKSRAQQGTYRLNLYGGTRYSAQPLAINIKVFGRNDIARLVNVLADNAPAANFDDRSQDLAVGDFSKVTSTGIQQLIFYVLPSLFIVLLAAELLR